MADRNHEDFPAVRVSREGGSFFRTVGLRQRAETLVEGGALDLEISSGDECYSLAWSKSAAL